MARLSAKEILGLALRAGFSPDREEAVKATAIALAESGGDPRAHNPKPPDNSFGLWQINMIGKLGPDRREKLGLSRNDELFDPPTNARAARLVFVEAGRDFTPWTTFTGEKPRFKDHLGAARQAATQLKESGFEFGIQPEPDLTVEELLDALASAEGQKALQAAVTHVLRVAVGPDDGKTPASRYFNELKADVTAIKTKVNQPPA
jgi:Lysozyme like domain